MNYQLLVTTFVGFFGTQSARPRRAAFWRLFVILGIALGFSWIAERSLDALHVPSDLPEEWLLFAAILLWQAMVCMVIWLSSATLAAGRDKLSHILTLWPVSAPVIWLVRSLPSLTLVGILIIVSFWPLSVVASKLAMPLPLWVFGSSIGILSGLAIGLYRPGKRLFTGLLLGTAVLWAEFILLQIGLIQLERFGQYLLFVTLALPLLICLPGGWLLVELRTAADPTPLSSSTRPVLSIPGSESWLAQKILRHKRSRLAWTITILASAAVTIGCIVQKVPLGNGRMLGLIAAILACGMATDMRPIARRQNPYEILGLQGTRAYVMRLGVTTLGLVLLAVSPLLGLMVGVNVNPWLAAVYGLALVMFGTTIGLLAGIVFVPENKDISAQLAATASSSLLLILFTRWPWFISLNDGEQGLFLIVSSVGLLGIACLVEQQRHKIYWRLNHA